MDAATITAWSGLVSAVVAGFIIIWRELRKNTETTNITHNLVNSRMDTMVESQKAMEDRQRINEGFQDTLIQHLKADGMTVPSNPADKGE